MAAFRPGLGVRIMRKLFAGKYVLLAGFAGQVG